MPERTKWLLAVLAEKPLFWGAIAGAVVLRHLTTKTLTLWGAVSTTISGVLCAVLFTPLVMEWFNLSTKSEPATAALLALLGADMIRLFLQSQSLADLIRAWRGK